MNGETPKIKKGLYKHYKGKLYKVVGVARHSETLEWMVVYEPQYNSIAKTWVRPYEMFISDIEVNGKTIKRFTYLDK